MLLHRIKQSLRFRRKWAQLGVYFLKSKDFDLSTLRVGGRSIHLHLPVAEREIHEHELELIFFDDCYHLIGIDPAPRIIVDVGANVGFFSLIAKHRYPSATIHAYEPNPALKPSLEAHLSPLDIQIYPEAVGATDGFIQLKLGNNSLLTTAEFNPNGTVPLTSIAKVIGRCNGSIDLLKLDCEGAEWDILARKDILEHVRGLRMEYHLWARTGSTIEDIKNLVEAAGFEIDFLLETEPGGWGLLGASRKL